VSTLRLCLFLIIPVASIVAATSACGDTSGATAPSGPAIPFTQIDLNVGTGAAAQTGNTLTVNYTGWLYDPSKDGGKGTQFDANNGFTFTLGAGQVIRGWDQGLVGMRVGGMRRLTVPPDLAYGSTSPSPKIPPNATLVFEIALTGVQ
jgi:FKBP-type peptidyl-prolyl cis-trans isomerase FkpA